MTAPTIAVALLTCDRPAYTARTIETFLAHNSDRTRFVLLHGDDASQHAINRDLAAAAGFETVVQHTTRQGNLATRTALIQQAAARAPWVLLLENDIASIRAFPWTLFDQVAALPIVYCLRLYGRFKDADQRDACKVHHQWRNQAPVTWAPMTGFAEPAEATQIHWSAQPCVTRAEPLVTLHTRGVRELRKLTARVVDNVMVHIGTARTAPPAREGVTTC